MALTATELRKNIYKLLDEILETGNPLEIERKGKRLRIFPDEPKSKLDNLKKRNVIVGDAEDIIDTNWEGEWKPFI